MFELTIWNAYLLTFPFCVLGICFMGLRRDIAKRRSGYVEGNTAQLLRII